MLLIGLDVEMREREESKMTLGGWFENKVDEVGGALQEFCFLSHAFVKCL